MLNLYERGISFYEYIVRKVFRNYISDSYIFVEVIGIGWIVIKRFFVLLNVLR